MESKKCKYYCGPTCVNGNCPMALSEHYPWYPVPDFDCEECPYNDGCETCASYEICKERPIYDI